LAWREGGAFGIKNDGTDQFIHNGDFPKGRAETYLTRWGGGTTKPTKVAQWIVGGRRADSQGEEGGKGQRDGN